MSREIKFRAWWDGRNEPVTPHMVEWEELCAEHFPYGFWPMREDSGFTLMQYTGLKDKNGVEIYEGDIIKSPEMVERFDGGYDDGLYICNWDKEVAGFFCGGITSSQMWLIEDIECEVIGNIYENKELLE